MHFVRFARDVKDKSVMFWLIFACRCLNALERFIIKSSVDRYSSAEGTTAKRFIGSLPNAGNFFTFGSIYAKTEPHGLRTSPLLRSKVNYISLNSYILGIPHRKVIVHIHRIRLFPT